MPRFDYFVILGEMRTGSNLLQERLNQFEGISCHGELFNPVFINGPRFDSYLGMTLEQREAQPFALLEAMRARPGLQGFRLFHNHDPRVRAHVLADPACAKIVLNRNPLDSYVSRKIAAETDQWKLNDVSRRRQARVAFDAAEFDAYLHRLQETQLEIQRALQIGGQSAFYINYEDLNDVAVLNGLAGWLGVPARVEEFVQKLKKQNPEPLEEKLTNPEALAPGLARIDRFDLGRTPNFEPRRHPRLGAMVAGACTPLLFMPVRGAAEDGIAVWLAALDGVPTGDLQRDFNHAGLREWRRAHPGSRAFTVLRHPVRRAHHVFVTRILNGAAQPVRRQMQRQFGARWPEPGEVLDLVAHRALFLAFLQFVRASLSGQTGGQPWPIWASQCALVEAMAGAGGPDHILREESLQQELGTLAGLFGHVDVPAAPVAQDDPMLALILDDEVEALTEACYRRDYERFGFAALRG